MEKEAHTLAKIAWDNFGIAGIIVAITCSNAVVKLGAWRICCPLLVLSLEDILVKLMDFSLNLAPVDKLHRLATEAGFELNFLSHFGGNVFPNEKTEDLEFLIGLAHKKLLKAFCEESITSKKQNFQQKNALHESQGSYLKRAPISAITNKKTYEEDTCVNKSNPQHESFIKRYSIKLASTSALHKKFGRFPVVNRSIRLKKDNKTVFTDSEPKVTKLENQTVDHQTQKSMSEGLSELVTVQKLWSTAVLCLYEAGKYCRVRLLDLFCEALSQHLYLSRVSDCDVGDEKDCDLSSTNDPRQQYSIMKSGGIIGKIVCKVRDLPTGMLYQLIESWEKLTADVSEADEHGCSLKTSFKNMLLELGPILIHDKLKILQSSVRCEDGKSSCKSSKDNSK
ncbi:hypothetical protein JHK87_022657 [Glycine soja]|nr:hypothetical protein JHK87_022657 [Glycine soja]